MKSPLKITLLTYCLNEKTKELKELFQESGYSFNDTQFNHVLRFADVDGSGTLDKQEFFAICSFLNAVQDVRKPPDLKNPFRLRLLEWLTSIHPVI